MEPEQTIFVILPHASLCLPCDLSHYLGAPDVTWQLEQRNSNNTNIYENGTLCITAAAAWNAGHYTCLAGDHSLTYTVFLTSEHFLYKDCWPFKLCA